MPTSKTVTSGATRRSRRAAIALAVAVAALPGCASERSSSRPREAEAQRVVRAYVAAYDRRDAATACRLKAPADISGCTINLSADFHSYGMRGRMWHDLAVTRLAIRPDHGLLRADVEVRYRRSGETSRRYSRDTWWLWRRTRNSPPKILRSEILNTSIFELERFDAASDRPIRDAQTRRPPKLHPQIACVHPVHRYALPRGDERAIDRNLRPVTAPWLDLVEIQLGRTPDGRACLRFKVATRWQVATQLGLDLEPMPLYLLARIDGDGAVHQQRHPRYHHVNVGATGHDLTIILPAGYRLRPDTTLSAFANSNEPLEPLLTNPIHGGDDADLTLFGPYAGLRHIPVTVIR
jgi:hypothetical protein